MDERQQAAASVGHEIAEVAEEMLEADLDPNVVSEEAYLAARRMFTEGHLTSIEEMQEEALRRSQEHSERDGETEGTIQPRSQNSWRWDHPNPEAF